MPTLDFVYDLLETLKSQKIDYLLVIDVQDRKENKMQLFSSLDEKDTKKLLKKLQEDSDKQEKNKEKNE